MTAYASPLFAPLRPWLERLPPAPDTRALAALADELPVTTDSGQRIRFAPPVEDGQAYECRIWERGEVETRPDNWHDFFNGLVWLAFPRTKIAITRAHVAAFRPTQADGRGPVRDGLTHFDECGVVVLASDPGLLDLLTAFDWKTLFVERRADVIAHMRFVVFGHATYEQLLQPFRGLTAKALLFAVDAATVALPPAELTPRVDALLAARIAREFLGERPPRPRDLQPVPLLGIPGVTADNEDPAYYDDTWQFRPGRRTAVRT